MSPRACITLVALAFVVNGCARNGARVAAGYAARGDRYLADGRYNAAVIEYRNAIKAEPTWAPGHAGLARVYEATGRAEEAYREYSNAIDLDANDAASRLAAGHLLFDAQMYQETQIRAEQVIDRDPHNADALVLLARAYAAQALETGDRAGAESVLRGVVRQVPDAVEAHVALGEFLATARRPAEAEAEFVQTVQHHRSDELANRALASFYLSNGRSSAAEPYLKAAAAAPHQRHASSLALADYYTEARRFVDARAALETVNDSTQQAGARVRLAAIEEEIGSHANARRMLDDVLKRSRTAEALALDAQLLLRDKKMDQAERSARAALDQDPRLPAANYVAGIIDLQQHQLADAERELREATTSTRLTAAANLQLARVVLAEGRADEAVELARAAGSAYDARLTLARALLATGDTTSARAELNRLQSDDSHDPAPAILLARLDLDAGDAAAARAHAEHAVAAAPNDATALLIAGESALAADDPQGAEPLLARAVTAQPSFDGATLLAQLYVQRRDYERAQKLFDSLARRYPDAAAPHTAAGIVLEAAGRQADARAAYEQAITLDPNDPVAAYSLARMYTADPSKLESAVSLAQTAAVGAPDRPDVHDALGWAYFKTGRLRSAADELERAVALGPQNAGYKQHLAEVRRALDAEKGDASVKRTAM